MNGYVWVSLIACTGCALTAGLILARAPDSRGNRRSALLAATGAFWAMCEVAWNTSADPETALFLVRLSAPGWIFIGPLAMDVLLSAVGDAPRRDRRWLRAAYAASAVLLVVEWTTPWLHPSVERTSWGFAYRFGPLFPVYYGSTIAAVAYGVVRGVQHFSRRASPGERRQGVWVLAGIASPLLVASLTDGVLPYLGHQPPRFGTLSLAVLSGSVAWSIHRFGYSLLAPGRFAEEIFEALSDGVLLVRTGGEIRIANRAAGGIAGCEPRALVGRPLSALLPDVPIDAARPLEEQEAEMCVAGARAPVTVASAPLRDKLGTPLGVIFVIRDMREVMDLRSRLLISARLAAVGELAAGIAHEINNPISYVGSNLNRLRDYWQQVAVAGEKQGPPSDLEALLADGEELIDESIAGVKRVAEIVHDVRGISHAGNGAFSPVQVETVLERVLRLGTHLLEARFERDFGEVPAVQAAPQELEQVFLNLVLNAGQAVGAGGCVRVRTRSEAGSVVVEVEDDGPGIRPDHLDRVFDPFFTTKPEGEGTGLGLAISYQIVRRHGGLIEVASQPGAGARFAVRLPVAPPEEEA